MREATERIAGAIALGEVVLGDLDGLARARGTACPRSASCVPRSTGARRRAARASSCVGVLDCRSATATSATRAEDERAHHFGAPAQAAAWAVSAARPRPAPRGFALQRVERRREALRLEVHLVAFELRVAQLDVLDVDDAVELADLVGELRDLVELAR